MAVKEDKDFEHKVFEELDYVRSVYRIWGLRHRKPWGRLVRKPKTIHIYWWEEFLNKVEWDSSCNPLMKIICKELWLPRERYYPIYSRSWSWYKVHTSNDDIAWDNTRYDPVNRVWIYKENKVDHTIDYVVWWYPPILTWLYVNRPKIRDNDVLLLLITKWRYANQKKRASETTDTGADG